MVSKILATIEGWPQIRGSKYYINAVRTKVHVSGYYREGGCSSGTAIKRGSTIIILFLQTYNVIIISIIIIIVQNTHNKKG